MKKYYFTGILLSLFHFLFGLNACLPNSQKNEEEITENKTQIEPPTDSLTHLTISSVGDLMCHSTQYQYAYQPDGTYNFAPVYDVVREYISRADIATGNLETVLAGKTKNYGGYPAFNTPNAYADGIKSAGFDIIITSNNHSLDQGEEGIKRTLKELKNRNLVSIGTFQNLPDRDSIRIFERNGIKLAIMAYTEFSNQGYPSGKKYLLNFIDSATVQKDIQQARKKGAEIVMINFHWGHEYQKEPSVYQKNMTNYAVQQGADIIIGHHPHCLQPFQQISKKNTKIGLDTAFVAYSLGNFYSNQRWRYSDAGVIVTFHLTKNKNTGKIRLEAEYLPTWLFKGQAEKRRRYIVLPSAVIHLNQDSINQLDRIPKEMKYLTANDRKLMRQADEDTKRILEMYGVKLETGCWKNFKPLEKLPRLDSIKILVDTLKDKTLMSSLEIEKR